MTEEVNEDEEGTVFCRADNAGIRIVIKEDREEDTGAAAYKIVITDCEGKEIRREWEYTAESAPEEQVEQQGDSAEPETTETDEAGDNAESATEQSEEQPEEPKGRLGIIEELFDTHKIAALADGPVTVLVEAEDAAGNRGESEFSFILDTVCPALAAAVSTPVGNPDAVDDQSGIVYYGKNKNHYSEGIPSVSVSFTVSDRNIDEKRLVTLLAYEAVPDGGNCEEITPDSPKEVVPDESEFITREQEKGDEQGGGSPEGGSEPYSAEEGQEHGGTVLGADQPGGNGGSANAGEIKTLKLSLIRYPGRDGTPDGVYRFGIRGTDKAGNPLRLVRHSEEQVPEESAEEIPADSSSEGRIPANSDVEDELYGVVCADAESGTFLTGRKVVDTAAPVGSLRVENNGGTAYCRMKEHAKGWVTVQEGFMPYRREKEAVIRYSAEDTSPVSVSYRIKSTSGDGNDAALDGSTFMNPCEAQTRIRGEQIFRVETLVFRDRAGNESLTLQRTVNLYLDIRYPNADIEAPSARVHAVSAITSRSADGRPLYAGSVTLKVSAEDPCRDQGASGLYEVRCEVSLSGSVVRSVTLYRGAEPSSDPDSEISPAYEYSGRIEIPSGGQWESNDIVVRVTAEDNAGNKSNLNEGGICRFGIDTTGPEITVRYDNNDVRNGLYFDRGRIALITVREPNFDKNAINISAPGAQFGEWNRMGDGIDGDSDVWTMEVRFPADGVYSLDVGGTDAIGNPASVRYTGEAPQAFVVDGTPPRIEVFWDNTDVRNGKYYNRARTATVRITDLSFDEDRVSVLPASTGFYPVSGSAATPAFGAQSNTAPARVARAGQVYEMELPFAKEGRWMLSCTCTDLAGNTAVPVAEPLFVLDFTAPRLYFDRGTVQEAGAYAGEIAPVLRWKEENPSPAACYASWVNVTAGGRTMGCRNGVSVIGVEGTDGALRASLPDPPLRREADGICVLFGTACDLAGNRAFVRRNLSVNRFGSLYDLSEDEETLQMISSYYTDGGAPFVVAEYNVSPLVKRQLTLYRNGIGRELTENEEYTVAETFGSGGWKYVYRIDPSILGEEGVYSLLLESDDEAGRHNMSPGRFLRRAVSGRPDSTGSEDPSNRPDVSGDTGSPSGFTRTEEAPESAYSPEWAVDRTPPTVRITGVDTDQHRFVTDTVSLSLIPADNMELYSLTIRITDDNGVVLEEQTLEKDVLREILDRNHGEVPVEVRAAGEWQTVTATAVDGAGNCSKGLSGLGKKVSATAAQHAGTAVTGQDSLSGEKTDDAENQGSVTMEQGYRLLVSSNPFVHVYKSGILPAAAFLALAAVVWIYRNTAKSPV